MTVFVSREHRFLNIQCQQQQVHDLGQPRPGRVPQPRQFRLVGNDAACSSIVDSVPAARIQHDESPDRWKEFIEKRAAYVAETVETRIFRQLELPYDQ